MERLNQLIDAFWEWTAVPEIMKKCDISNLMIEPFCFWGFEEMRKKCISKTNENLTVKDIEAILFCIALDDEEEVLLNHYKENASDTFLYMLVSAGIKFPQTNTRWQIAELLQRPLPNRNCFLAELANDSDPYVRKRTKNVQEALAQQSKTGCV